MPYMNLKKFAKIIPYFGSFIIFCGILKLSIYYKSFNISINDYLDISEVLTLFVGDIVFYTVMITIIGVLFFLAEEEKTTMKIHDGIEKAMSEKSFIKRLKILLSAYDIFPLLLAILPISLIMYFLKKIDMFQLLSLIISISSILMIVIILFEVEKKHFSLSGNRFDPFFKQIVYLFLLIIIFTISSSFVEIHEVKIKKKYSETKFQIDETIIISDDQNYFIGKTNKYLFFFKSKLNETEVYPMDRIKMISFLKKDNKK